MPILNDLGADSLRTVNRLLAWLLILMFGYVVAAGIALDPSGWDDPVFNVVRQLPYTPYSWAGLLAGSVTVYTVGELISEHTRRRGAIVITGATLCTAWWLAMSMAMARMVYVMPTRITILWPFITFAIACLFASRSIAYANAFTGARWNTNPYQLYGTLFLMIASTAQIIIGVVPSSVFTEVERPVAAQLALINFMGGAVVMFGLHLKNKELGINLEMSGAISLVATIAWYCVEVIHRNTLAGTTLGFALNEAFLFATFHRATQIATMKWARWRDKPRLEARMSQAINAERHVVIEPDDIVSPPRPKPRHGR